MLNFLRAAIGLVCGVLLATSIAAGAEPQPAKRPNVVLFVADDHGRDAGCYGNPVIKTPNLDRLAADGTRFEYAFCTTASCSPSRSVILSGQYNHANGQYGLQHGYQHFQSFDSVQSLPVILSKGGYRTARIGKLHVMPDAAYHFETAIDDQGGARNSWTMADKCRAWLAASDERPFFLYFCTTDPHRSAKPRSDLPHAPNAFANDGKYEHIQEVKYDPAEVIVPPFLPDTPECRAELAQYYQSVSRMDQGLGHLIDVLRETGQWGNTLFIYIADNGSPFPGAKTTTYEPGIRLPCIVRSPSQQRRGVVSNAMINWADLAPTILEFCDVAVPPKLRLHGRSFAGVLETENPSDWDEVYASHTFHEVTMYYPMRVVRTRRYKLIMNLASGLEYPFASDLFESATWQRVLADGRTGLYGRRTVEAYLHRPRWELYDLEADPDEIHNLAEDAAHAMTLAELQAKLHAFQQRTFDPWILKWERE